jgi:hypothetical protein
MTTTKGYMANNNPVLYQEHRRTIGANVMNMLCKKDYYAGRNPSEDRQRFLIDELWEDLESFNKG